MFEVIKQVTNNPFKPDIIDSTTIVLKQSQPFVQMSYKYDGDLTTLADEDAINKVLDDFYKENYNDKIQEGKLTDLELAFAKQNKQLEEKLNELGFQNELTSRAIIELTEVLLADVSVDDIEESEVETDEGDSYADGNENQE